MKSVSSGSVASQTNDASGSSNRARGAAHRPAERPRPAILGIWRLGKPIQRGTTTELALAQPADATGSPRWDYVIKRAVHSDDIEACQQITRFTAAAAAARHPNLVAVLDASTSPISPYVVMPRLDGHTMQCHLDQSELKPLPVGLWLVRQVAQALATLHAAGWVHGDVKPANVMVGSRGHVTLVDLGFATPVHTMAGGHYRGTPDYCAPEAFVDNRAAMPAMDIYSLGRVLANGLTRSEQVSGRSIDPVTDLVARMSSEKPSDRPDAAGVATELLRLEIETLGHHIGPRSRGRRAA